MKFKFLGAELEEVVSKIRQQVKEGNAAYILEIHKAKAKRSLNQNSYYWGVVVTILADETGYTIDEVHQELGGMFLRYQKSGKEFTRSTATLDTLEFELYLERCRKWAWNDMNITIPLPNEVTEEMFSQIQRIQQ